MAKNKARKARPMTKLEHQVSVLREQMDFLMRQKFVDITAFKSAANNWAQEQGRLENKVMLCEDGIKNIVERLNEALKGRPQEALMLSKTCVDLSVLLDKMINSKM